MNHPPEHHDNHGFGRVRRHHDNHGWSQPAESHDWPQSDGPRRGGAPSRRRPHRGGPFARTGQAGPPDEGFAGGFGFGPGPAGRLRGPGHGRPGMHPEHDGPDGPGFGPAFDGRDGGGPHHDRRRRRSEERGEFRGGPRRHGRGRAQRGDVRAALLLLLTEEPMHGYQLMQAIAERTGGVWRPSPGAVYPTLAQLEDEGLVEVVAERGRKQASITELGRTWVADHAEEVGDPFQAATTEGSARPDLRGTVHQLLEATRQIGRHGSDAQVSSAAEVLSTARRSLYLLLADGAGASTTDSAEAAPTDTPDES